MTLHPLFAGFLGGWEIILILAAFMFWVLVITVIAALVYFLRRRQMPTPNPPIPAAAPTPPTPAATTQVTQNNCPHCGKPVPPMALGGICPECMLKAGLAAQTEGPGGGVGPQGTKIIQPPLTPAEIAALFPQLEILECLGRGGMGVVYKARQPRLNRLVALKILAQEKDQDGQFTERFAREAQALARLSHPNIVTVHDFGCVGSRRGNEADVSQSTTTPPPHVGGYESASGGLFYLVMEFVDGLNLRQLLLNGKMTPEQALTIVPKICEALQYAHEQGIVHRDIKPENILLDKSGRVKIADFGIAKILGVGDGRRALTGAKDVVGTPHYMAPEQLEKPLTVDHRADIYSLGVVFYEMLTGELPLGKFALPSKKVQIDVRLDEVVMHTLEKEPERRYQQVNQLKTDVETISGTVPPAAGFAAKRGALPLQATASGKTTSDKIILPAFLMAFFFGVFGAHRFYVGKIWTAFLQLAALGGCILLIIACATLGPLGQPITGILLGFLIFGCIVWAAIDWILILCKAFTDGQGRRMTYWLHPQAGSLKTGPSPMTGSPSSPPPGRAAPPIAAGFAPPPQPVPEKKPASGTGMIVAPAVGLMLAAGLKLVGVLFNAQFLLPGGSQWLDQIAGGHQGGWISGLIGGTAIFESLFALFIGFGAFQMLRLRSYAWSVAAAILAIVSCGLFSLGMGIWALIVLGRQDVRETFANQPKPQPAKVGIWPWLLGSVLVAGVIVIGLIISTVLVRHHKIGGTSHANIAGTAQSVAGARGQQALPVQTNGNPSIVPAAHEDPSNTLNLSAQNAQVVIETTNGTLKTDKVQLQTDSKGNTIITASKVNYVVAPVAPVPPVPSVPPVPPVTAGAKMSSQAPMAESPNEPYAHRTKDGFQQDFSQTLPLTADGRLALDNVNGKIAISGWDRDELDIQAVKHGKSKDSVEELAIQVDAASDHATIHTKQAASWFGWKKDSVKVDYAIHLPQQARLANISSVNGQIVIDGVAGNIEASTVNGGVQVRDVAGDLKLSTVNGEVKAQMVALGSGQSVSLDAVNGQLELSLPANANAEVSASTLNGSLNSEFSALVVKKEFPVGSNLKGMLGNGSGRVKASTVNGSISFRKGSEVAEGSLNRNQNQRDPLPLKPEDKPQPDSPTPPASPQELAARYEAANAISAFDKRDAALAALAKDAAASGDSTLVKKVIGKISMFTARDDAAYESAMIIARVGRRPDAIEVAKMITSFTKRDAALRELAE